MKFVAGSLAGLTAVSATFPLDTIRARLAFQVVGETKYQGILHAGGSIMRTEGAVGLYRGLTPTLLGIIPYAGLSFYFFELLKTKLLKHFLWARSKSPSGEMTLVLSAKLLCGGLAGALSQTISYPLDVARWASVNLNLVFQLDQEEDAAWCGWEYARRSSQHVQSGGHCQVQHVTQTHCELKFHPAGASSGG